MSARARALLAAAALAAAPARASVFHQPSRLAPGADGLVTIPVCLVEGSSAEEKSPRCRACAHGVNPGLTRVVAQVRKALAESWEAHGGVRFVGFDWCRKLSPAEAKDHLGLYLHPGAVNAAYPAAHGRGKTDAADAALSFKPWGNDARCIALDWSSARMAYRFECVEQYAIHEFGHVLGFQHEWHHPKKPEGCTEGRAEPLPDDPADFSVVGAAYDWDSIMTYTDACAQVTGVRFGSPRLSPGDVAGLEAAYPRAGPTPSAAAATPELGPDTAGNGWPPTAAGLPAAALLAGALLLRLRRRR